jgi:hypothetical protein
LGCWGWYTRGYPGWRTRPRFSSLEYLHHSLLAAPNQPQPPLVLPLWLPVNPQGTSGGGDYARGFAASQPPSGATPYGQGQTHLRTRPDPLWSLWITASPYGQSQFPYGHHQTPPGPSAGLWTSIWGGMAGMPNPYGAVLGCPIPMGIWDQRPSHPTWWYLWHLQPGIRYGRVGPQHALWSDRGQ